MAKAKTTETKTETEQENVVPVTVGNPAEAASLAIDQSHLEEFANLEEQSSIVRCEKPWKGVYFTVLPEPGERWKNRNCYFLLEIEGRDLHLVDPNVAKEKKDEDVIRPVLIVRCVTMAGEEFLWPLKLDQQDKKSNSWNKSAMNVLGIAEKGTKERSGQKWVRLKTANGHYHHVISPRTIEQCPPKFSDRTFDELIDIAFKDRKIVDLDHEIWKVLDEGSTK
jgi:hypothetical protein